MTKLGQTQTLENARGMYRERGEPPGSPELRYWKMPGNEDDGWIGDYI